MCNNVYGILMGISILPLVVIWSAGAESLTARVQVGDGETRVYDSADVSNFIGNFAGGAIYDVLGILSVDGPISFAYNSVTYDPAQNAGLGGDATLINGNGGAILNAGGNITLNNANTTTYFTGNKALSGVGGAIQNYGNIDISGMHTIFSNNKAKTGGAISLVWNGVDAGVLSINGKAKFDNNQALGGDDMGFGGAVYVDAHAQFNVLSANEVMFDKNDAALAGGAIYNIGQVNIGNNTNHVKFFNSNATQSNISMGGAIFNRGQMNIAGATNEFRNNKVYAYAANNVENGGGAIQNMGVGTGGGAALVIGKEDLSSVNTFDNNESFQHGGAIYARAIDGTGNNSTVIINGSDNIFTNNKAHVNGGAIANYIEYKDSTLGSANFTINGGASFTNNGYNDNTVLVDNGGAIYNNGTFVLNDGGIFTGNKATGNGGAIAVDTVGSSDCMLCSVTINGDATFTGNIATNGGAVWTADGAYFTISDATSVVFENNHDAVRGGAIWNAGTASINAANIAFTNNSVSDNGGAIYNTGTFIINGDAAFAENAVDGIANDIHNSGEFKIMSGTTTIGGGITGTGTLTIGTDAILDIGTTSLQQGTVKLNGRLVALLDNPDSYAKLNVGNFTGTGTLALTLRNEGTYELFRGAGTVAQEHIDFSDAGITLDSPLYNIVWDNDGKYITASRKTPIEIAAYNSLSNATGQTISDFIDSSSAQLNDLAFVMQHHLAFGDSHGVEHAHAAVNPETTPVLQSISVAMQNTVANMAAGRMDLGAIGRSGGDVTLTSGGVWAQGIYNKTKQNDAFNGYTRGIAFGLDGTVNGVWTLGVGYAYAHSDVAATARNTEVESLSIFAYGQYKPADWYVNTVINYTTSDYSELGDALGVAVKSDYDVRTFGATVMAGYNFTGGITPQFGLRYVHVSTDDYRNSLDIAQSVEDAGYLTAVLETKYAHRFDVRGGWSLIPMVQYGVLCDIITDNHVVNVTIPGLSGYTLTGDRLSRMGTEFGLGLMARYKDIDLSLNYDIEVREDYTSQTGRLKFRYNF